MEELYPQVVIIMVGEDMVVTEVQMLVVVEVMAEMEVMGIHHDILQVAAVVGVMAVTEELEII